MRLRQYDLRDGTTHTVSWLPDDKRLRPGSRVTLKDSETPKRLWTVLRRGNQSLDREAIHREWRVGGL